MITPPPGDKSAPGIFQEAAEQGTLDGWSDKTITHHAQGANFVPRLSPISQTAAGVRADAIGGGAIGGGAIGGLRDPLLPRRSARTVV